MNPHDHSAIAAMIYEAIGGSKFSGAQDDDAELAILIAEHLEPIVNIGRR